MSRFWLRYEKSEDAKYISHLDFLRAMTRTLKRAHIPVSYSQGFNPHPKLSFALPLPLGTTSICELMELELDRDLPPEELCTTLNRFVPFGLHFIEAGVSPDKSKFRRIAFSKYRIKPDNLPDPDLLSAFFDRSEIVTEKRTKSGTRPTDIKKDIASLSVKDDALFMVLAAGNDANLKPETVMTALTDLTGYAPGDWSCTRIGILDAEQNYI